MSKGVVVQIGIVGKFTNDNLNLVSKCKGNILNVSSILIKIPVALFIDIFFDFVIKPFFLPGKSKLSENDQIWQAIPLLCFQNDLSLESALNVGLNIHFRKI